jgi:hypothetical protein
MGGANCNFSKDINLKSLIISVLKPCGRQCTGKSHIGRMQKLISVSAEKSFANWLSFTEFGLELLKSLRCHIVR